MATVTFERLRLEGFGQFAEPVEVHFQQGVNVVIAPNERGKSTIVAGIGAVLFGVEQSEDATRFSQGRFRCWYEHSRFRGELELCTDGNLYLIERDFTNNHVQFSFRDEDTADWQRLRENQHNPRARKRLPAIDNLLRSLLGGIGHLRLFEATFCVPQILPMESQLSNELQRLLSGGDAYQRATEKLRDTAKGITMYTSRLKMTVQDSRKEGRLEHLERQISSLRRQVEDSRANIAKLHETQARQRQIEEEERKLTFAIGDLNQRIQIYRKWIDYCNEYQRIVREQQSLEGAFNKSQRIQDELRSLQEDLKRCPDWCRQTDDPVKVVMQARMHWENLLRDWEQFTKDQAAFTELDKVISEQYQVFEQASDEERELLKRYESEWLKRKGQCERIEHDLQRLRQQWDYYREEESRYLGEFAALDSLPPDALQSLQEKIDLLTHFPSKPVPIRWFSFFALILAGAGLAALAALGGMSLVAFLVTTSFGAASLLLQVRQVQRRRAAERQWSEYQERLQQVNQRLGFLAEENSTGQLRGLRDRLMMRDERKRDLDERRSKLPSLETIQRIEEELEVFRRQLKDFEERMQHYVIPFRHNLQEEFNRYLSLRQRREQLNQRLSEYAQRFDVHWSQLTEKHCDNLAEPFGALRSEMGLPNSCMSYGQLMVHLSKLSVDLWTAKEKEARNYSSLEQKIREKEAQLAAVLGEDTLQSLHEKKITVQNQAMSILSELRSLCEQMVNLPQQYDEESARRVRLALQSIESERSGKMAEKEEVSRQLRQIYEAIGRLEATGIVNIAKAEEEIAALEQERQKLRFEVNAIAEAYGAITEAAIEFHENYRRELAESISEYFARFTGRTEKRKVNIDENFRLRIFQGEREFALSQLSRGAIDQLYLAVRFAVADFLADNVKLPLIFDDSFVHCDENRRNIIRRAIDEVAKERQVIILSHDRAFQSWGRPVKVTRPPTQK